MKKKLHKNYELCITLYYEYVSSIGDITTISINHKIYLETLIAMGLELQKDLYNELISQLDNLYENIDAIAITDFYTKLGYSQPALNPVHLPLSNIMNEDKGYIHVKEDMFIPEFRLFL